jgi:branched-chain amino acid aminotransferase
MVITYEVIGNSIAQIGESADMSQAAKQLPQGAYTTFRTYDKTRLLRLGQHTDRLVESVALMGGPAPLSEPTLRAAVGHVLQKNTDDRAESRVRITFAPPRLFVSVEAFTPYPQSLYEQGVMCATVPLHRENPHAKNTAFSLVAKAAQAGLPSAAHEGLMLAADGAILEGLSSNFFAIDAAGVLRTEQERVLMGVTRSIVLELAAQLAPVSLAALRRDELPTAKECFITSVSRQVLPVVQIDNVVIGDGDPGPITRQIMGLFNSLVEKDADN